MQNQKWQQIEAATKLSAAQARGEKPQVKPEASAPYELRGACFLEIGWLKYRKIILSDPIYKINVIIENEKLQ